MAYRKVLGSQKPGDVLTKHVPADLLQKHREALGTSSPGGRAETAPELNTLEAIVVSWEEADTEEGAEESGGKEEQTKQKKVRFAPKVQYRAVPSANRGRECRGAARKEWQGRREPRAGGASLRRGRCGRTWKTTAPRPPWTSLSRADNLNWAFRAKYILDALSRTAGRQSSGTTAVEGGALEVDLLGPVLLS